MDEQRFGHYRLDGLLGRGGMGEVYRAYDTERDRAVALKVLPRVLAADEEYRKRFRRESYHAARLREPHVIPIHDYGEIDGRLYIDMRLVDGSTVADLLAEHGAMGPEQATNLISQVADALDAAHAEGLVHRDIKPSNVLVTPAQFVYVVDFGIAHVIGTRSTVLTMTGTTVGTLDYMAPERFQQHACDGRADVYSLTCLLCQCLTGRPPFEGDDLPSLLYAHLYTPPPRPSTLNPAVPAAMDAVAAMGMAKHPDHRFTTAGELAAAARAALGAAPTKPGASGTATVAAPAVAAAGAARDGSDAVPPPAQRVPEPAGAPVTGTAPPAPPPAPPGSAGIHPPPAPAGRSRRPVLIAVAAAALVLLVGAAVFLIQVRDATRPTGPTGPTVAGGTPDVTVAASVAIPRVGPTIPAGAPAGFVAVAPNGQQLYVANRAAGTVTVIDTAIDRVTATIPIDIGPPQFIAFSPDGSRAYVSVFTEERTVNRVAVLDTATNTVLTSIPVGVRPFALAVAPDGRRLYVPNHDSGSVSVIDTATNAVTAEIPVAANPHWVTFSPDGSRLWMANHESNVVSTLDTATNTVLGQVPTGTSPHSVDVSPDGTRVANVDFDAATVTVTDTATNEVVATVPVGVNPQALLYAPDGRFLYVVNVTDDTLSVISTESNQVTATIPTGDGPTSIGLAPDGSRAYVSNLNDGTVLVLNTAAG